jgi:elongation factor G
MVDTRVTIREGEFKEGVSSELAFRVASNMAVKEAARDASPQLLEPVMSLEVITPQEFMGEIIGDLNSRKGRIINIIPRGVVTIIKAVAPLSRMFGYSTALRSASQGRATFTMQFSHYDTAELQQQIY